MSDHLATEIRIGGKMPAKVVSKLLELIRAERLVVGWEEEPFTAKTSVELLDLTRDDELPGTLQLVHHEAAWGRFEDLEAFLCKHGIAFDRRTEGKYQYDAELARFRSGMKEPCVRQTDQSGQPVVSCKNLQSVVDALEQQHARKALQELRSLLGSAISPLEPLQIVPKNGTKKGRGRQAPRKRR